MTFSIRGDGQNEARQRYLELVAALQLRNQAHVASGKRIATAADDAAGLAIAKRLEAEGRGMAQGERNLSDGQGVVRTAEAALQSSNDTLARMRELTIQARNGTLSAGDRVTIQQEYDQLTAQIDQTAAGTGYGGRTLLDGSLQGDEAMPLNDGSGNTTTLAIGDMRAAALGIAGRSVGDPATLTALDHAAELLASERAQLGTLDSGLDRQQQRLGSARDNAEAARARIEDVDVARAVAATTRDRILTDLQLAGQRIADHSRGRLLDLLG